VTILYLPPFDPMNTECIGPNEIVVQNASASAGVHFVSLRSGFNQLSETGRAPYGFANTRFNEGHWNRHGHRVAAEILAEDLKPILNAIY